MTTIELKDKIRNWEIEAGESFTDYFMHDNVQDSSWAFWLLGKGFTERANAIIDLLLKGETCLDLSLLYEVQSSELERFDEEVYEKDVLLWAEFLLGTKFYEEKVLDFLKENE